MAVELLLLMLLACADGFTAGADLVTVPALLPVVLTDGRLVVAAGVETFASFPARVVVRTFC